MQPHHADKLGRILDRLDAAVVAEDMNFPGSDFHQLTEERKNEYSVHVNGNYCVCFEFESGNAYNVNYEDYH